MNDRFRDGSERSFSHEGQQTDGRKSDHEFSAAMKRFEQAVEGLAHSARDHFGNRATRFINEATSRIEREASRQARRQERRERRRSRYQNIPTVYRDDAEAAADDAEGAFRGSGGYRRQAAGRLYRNRYRRKIAGVCAGLAPYLGVQTWVVRGAAITGALFFPMIVVPAYVLAMIFVPEAPRTAEPERVVIEGTASRKNGADPGVPEPSVPRNVRRDFRDTQALLSQAELRLRRMEAHVTSDRYELQKELHRLEHGGKSGGAVA